YEYVEIDCELASIVPEGVPERIPARDGNHRGCPASVGRSAWTWAGIFRKGSGSGGIRAGVHEEAVPGRTRPSVEDVVLKKIPGVVIDRRVPVKAVVEVRRGVGDVEVDVDLGDVTTR